MISSKLNSRALRGLAAVLMLIPTVASAGTVTAGAPSAAAVTPVKAALSAPTPKSAYGALPLRFDANIGQAASAVLFEANSAGISTAITSSGATLRLLATSPLGPARPTPTHPSNLPSSPQPSSAVLQIQLVGGSALARPAAVQRLGGLTNYFIGSDPAGWRTGVPSYGQIIYRSAYSRIDLLYRGSPGLAGFEYDFAVHPLANAGLINVALNGATALSLDSGGNLMMVVGGRNLLQLRPVAYQMINGARRAVSASYVLRGGNQFGFRLGTYYHSYSLFIDPVLTYSTYQGGSGFDAGYGVAVDSAGLAYVTGITTSTDFPTAASVSGPNAGHARVFVSKLNAAGTGLVYSTYLGGSGDEEGLAIALDSGGHAVVAGTTTSSNFPLVNAAQATFGGGSDAFVAELNASGNALAYSTYLGGGAFDLAYGVGLDPSGNAYVTGVTHSTDFPTAAALQASSGGNADAFATKLSPTGAIAYSTYLGAAEDDGGAAIAVDSSGAAYIAGVTTSTTFPTAGPLQAAAGGSADAFVTKIDASGSSLAYSTYLGGTGYDTAIGIALDQSGNAFVTGYTGSTDFPTAQPFQASNRGGGDAFISKLNPDGASLVYSSYLGGAGLDLANSIAVDWYGSAYVTGATSSTDFPSFNALQGYRGNGDTFVAQVTQGGGLTAYSTYVGGTGIDGAQSVAVDSAGAAYVVGTTTSANFPISGGFQTANRGGNDVFIAKLPVVLTPSSWPTYMSDQTRSGVNSSQVLLNPSTAGGLRQIWSSHADGFVTGQPVTGNGHIYWGAFDGYERSSDPSGKTLWATFLGKTVTESQPIQDCLGGDIGVSGTSTLVTTPGGPVLYVAGGDANFYALNANTGAILWQTALGVKPDQFLWGSPLYYGGSIYEGVASFQECPPVQGQMIKMNATTGAITNVWKVVPDGCTSGPISATPAIDPVSGILYIATGSAHASCPGPYDTAMVALRASDLSLVGSWQIPVADQTPDSDFIASPMLFTGTVGFIPRKLVGIVDKNGVYYAFDRANISAGPVWTANIGAPGDCPPCGPDGAAIAPSAWDGSSVYVGGNRTTIDSVSCNGSIRALDPATGAFKWEKCLGSIVMGAVSASNGLVVVVAGPYLYVLSAATGATLYTFHDTNPGPPFPGTADFWGGPSIGQGIIYAGNIDGNLFAFSV